MTKFKVVSFISLFINTSVMAYNCNVDFDGIIHNPKMLETFAYNCPLVKINPENQKVKVEKILADKLANKLRQGFEDISAVESYYWSKKVDLGKTGSSDLKNSCTLNALFQKLEKDPACVKNKDSKNQKLSILKKALGGNEADALSSVLGNVYTKIRAINSSLNKSGACPLVIGSTSSRLNSTFSEANKKIFIDSMTNKSIESLNDNPILREIPKDKKVKLINSFNREIGSIAADKKLDYVDDFFKSKEVVENVSENLGSKCTDIFNSVVKFSCEDFDGIPTEEKNITSLMDNNDDVEFKVGITCSYHQKISDAASGKINQKLLMNTDQTISDIKSKIRPFANLSEDKSLNTKLCNLYTCQPGSKVAKLPSCKKSGPLSSADLKNYCDGDEGCDSTELKFLSFLETFEKEHHPANATNVASNAKDPANNSVADTKKASGSELSSFNMNFLGVEGTLIAEGKAVTPKAIEEKRMEFKENGISPEVIAEETDSANKILPKEAVPQVVKLANNTVNNPINNTYVPNAISQENKPIMADAPVAPINNKTNDVGHTSNSLIDTKALKNKNNYSINESVELSNMRDQLDELLNKMKNPTKEKVQTITDENIRATTPVNQSALNSIEEARLQNYRRSLENWENDLRIRHSNLNKMENDFRSEKYKTNDSKNNQFNENSANSLTLTKTDSGRSGASNGRMDSGSVDNKGIAKNQKGVVTPGADNLEVVVDSKDLGKVDRNALTSVGINLNSLFFIKVKYEDKFFMVPVKMFNIDGREMLVPIFNRTNKHLSQIVLEGPLFKDYLAFQKNRENAQRIKL